MIRKLLLTVFLLLCCLLPLLAYSYDELCVLSSQNNDEVKKLRSSYYQSLLDLKDAKSGYGPTVDLTVSASYIGNPMDKVVVNTDQVLSSLGLNGQNLGYSDDYVTLYKGQESTYYQFKLDITQPLYTWGKLENSVKLYTQVSLIRALQIDELCERNNSEIKGRMYALYYLGLMVDVVQGQQSLASQLIEASNQSAKLGLSLSLDALEAEVTLRQLDVLYNELEKNLSDQLCELGVLVGQDLGYEDLSFDVDEAAMLSLLEQDQSLLEQKAIGLDQTSLKLLAELENVSVLTNQIARGSVNWKPDFALVTSLDYSGSRMPLIEKDWYGKDTWSFTATVAFKTTVWDGGKAVRNVQRTQSQLQSSQIDIELAQNTISSALKENLANMKLSKAKLDYSTAKLEVLQSKVESSQSLLDQGYGSRIEVLKASLDKESQALESLKAKLEMASSYCTIEYLALD